MSLRCLGADLIEVISEISQLPFLCSHTFSRLTALRQELSFSACRPAASSRKNSVICGCLFKTSAGENPSNVLIFCGEKHPSAAPPVYVDKAASQAKNSCFYCLISVKYLESLSGCCWVLIAIFLRWFSKVHTDLFVSQHSRQFAFINDICTLRNLFCWWRGQKKGKGTFSIF